MSDGVESLLGANPGRVQRASDACAVCGGIAVGRAWHSTPICGACLCDWEDSPGVQALIAKQREASAVYYAIPYAERCDGKAPMPANPVAPRDWEMAFKKWLENKKREAA